MKGEIDLVGYDGQTLAFVEVKTRVLPQSADRSKYRLPEQAVTEKSGATFRAWPGNLLRNSPHRCSIRTDLIFLR